MFVNDKKEIDLTIDNINICSTKKINPLTDLSVFNKNLADNIKSKFSKFNPIQQYTIPAIMEGGDVICKAPTGSGKTFCYLIPIICRILKHPDSSVVIICPVRELCTQISEICNDLVYKLQVTKSNQIDDGFYRPKLPNQPITVYSIHKFYNQPSFNILVATPGRLIDFLTKKIINFNNLKMIIFDEADRMYDSNFKIQIDVIKKFITTDIQTCMFSATYSEEIKKIFDFVIKKDRICIEANYEDKTTVVQEVYSGINKIDKICDELKTLTLVSGWRDDIKVDKVIIFVEKKVDCANISKSLSSKGFSSVILHGDRLQSQRNEALQMFKLSHSSILIATSVAARGIDIKNVNLVINYNLPHNIDDYIHRIGRTGRAGEEGKAMSFYDESTDNKIRNGLIQFLKDTNQNVPRFLIENINVKNNNNVKINYNNNNIVKNNYNNKNSQNKYNNKMQNFKNTKNNYNKNNYNNNNSTENKVDENDIKLENYKEDANSEDEVLGACLPKSFDLNLTDLKMKFYDLSKKYHPDINKKDNKKFQDINNAYQVLKDDFLRAKYLKKTSLVPKVSQDFLMEVLEVEDQIQTVESNKLENIKELVNKKIQECKSKYNIDEYIAKWAYHRRLQDMIKKREYVY